MLRHEFYRSYNNGSALYLKNEIKYESFHKRFPKCNSDYSHKGVENHC